MLRSVLVAAALLSTIGRAAVAQQPKSEAEAKADVLKAELFIAIRDHDLSGVKSAIAQGADVNSRNWLQFTPLMWAGMRGEKSIVDLLIAKGAKLNATSIYGSALTFAAEARHEALAIDLLVRGADPSASRLDGVTPLMLAATDGESKLLQKLLDKKSNPNTKDSDGATALIFAARNGRVNTANALIRAGAEVNATDSHGRSALMYAALNGHGSMVDYLIAHTAAVNATDKQGSTALLLAARYNGDGPTVRSLLKAGATAAARDKTGQTPLALAQARRYDEAVAALRPVTAQASVIPAVAPSTTTARSAVQNGINALQVGLKTFIDHTQCTSCHHQGLGLMTLGNAAKHGFTVDQALAGRILKKMGEEGQAMGPAVHRALTDDRFAKTLEAVDIGDFSIGGSYIFGGMAAMGIPSNPGFTELSLLLAKFQSPSGSWVYGFEREPIQSSYVTTTAFVLNILRTYGPKDKLAGNFEAAKKWLLSTSCPNSEDKASRLLGLKWAGASRGEMEKPLQELLAAQRPDGGWAQLPSLRSDAYATGMSLYAMRIAGEVPAGEPAFQRGTDFLLRTQDEDGSWYVNKRAAPANTYFDAGFPHGESQFISFGATCWATMALMEAQPTTQTASR